MCNLCFNKSLGETKVFDNEVNLMKFYLTDQSKELWEIVEPLLI